MPGGSQKVTVGYKYYLGIHMGLFQGVADRITRIEVDKRLAWGGSALGSITVDAPELFGGDSREGGVSGTVTIETGTSDQVQNAYLVEQLGSDAPAFRGLTCAVLEHAYVGNNPYLKPWSFRAQRIYKARIDEDQWYAEKAGIPNGQSDTYSYGYSGGITTPVIDVAGPFMYQVDSIGLTTPADEDLPTGPLFRSDGTGEGATGPFGDRTHPSSDEGFPTPATIVTAAYVAEDQLKRIWVAKQFYLPPNQPVGIYIKADNFVEVWLNGRHLEGRQESAWTTGLEDPPGLVYGGYNDITFYPEDSGPKVASNYIYAGIWGTTYTLPPGDPWNVTVDHLDMNPSHIIRETLTDPDWGMGYQDSDIDDDSFTSAADTLYDEGMGISLLWSKEIPIEEFIMEILRHIDGVLYVDRRTGKFKLKLVRDDFAESDLIVLDESNVIELNDKRIPTIDDLASSVTVQYWDSVTGEQGSVTEHNQALQQIQQGNGGATTAQYPGFTYKTLASRVARRDLISLSTPLISCTISATRIAENLYPGDAFILDLPDQGINSTVMRVQQMGLGDGVNNVVVIIAVQDVFAMPSVASVGGSQDSLWTDPLSDNPLPSVPRVVEEAPYYEIVLERGDIETNTILDDDNGAGFLLVAGGRQGSELSGQIHVDSGAGYVESSQLDFVPYAYISSDVGYTDTTIYLTGGKDLDLVEEGGIAQIDDELLRVDAIGSDSNGGYYIDVGRGILDTVPAEHIVGSNGNAVLFWGISPESDQVQYTASDEVNVKIRTVLAASVLPIGDAPEDTVTFASRAIRPYPPGDLRVDGISYPETEGSSGVIFNWSNVISWTHRDRLQQTDGNLFDYTDGDIGPEAGSTYLVEVFSTLANYATSLPWISYNVGGASEYDFATDIDSNADEIPANTTLVNVRVSTLRGGYSSWQSPVVSMIYESDSSVVIDPPFSSSIVSQIAPGGTDGDTTLTDQASSPPSWTFNGGAVIDDAQSKDSTVSLLLTSSGYLSSSANARWAINAASALWTIHGYIRPTANNGIIAAAGGGVPNWNTGNGLSWLTYINSSGKLEVQVSEGDGSSPITLNGGTITLNVWQHYAVTCDGTNIYGFIDGVNVFTGSAATMTSTIATPQAQIGRLFGAGLYFAGHIQGHLVNKGECYWTADFTPPELPLPTA